MGRVWAAVVVRVLVPLPVAVVLGRAIGQADRQEPEPPSGPPVQAGLPRTRERSRPMR